MDWLAYMFVAAAVKGLQSLPLSTVARIGRLLGGLTYRLDKRHRLVALENLRAAFAQDPTSPDLHALAREHFCRLGENYCAAVKTAAMSDKQLFPHLEVIGAEHIRDAGPPSLSRVIAIGHFGNFELYARVHPMLPQFTFATTYRALKQPRLDQLLARLRSKSGCLLFERRRDAKALQAALSTQPLVLGLLSDQHAGRGGLWLPFLGRMCSTTPAPAVLAARYRLPLLTAICYRTRPAHWRIEISPPIPTVTHGRRRAVPEIMTDVNTALGKAVLRDPSNWFWVHKRWKPHEKSSPKLRRRTASPGA